MAVDQRLTSIRFYTRAQWVPMWQLRFAQLAEHGIHLDPAQIVPESEGDRTDSPEWDMAPIDKVYLRGGGGFWLAWQGDEPVGYVGAQDLGAIAELRRMYVKATHRRQGIGTQLVQALIEHCHSTGIKTVELWTDGDGPGRMLYERLGFRKVSRPLLGFDVVEQATRRGPNPDEIRMRLTMN